MSPEERQSLTGQLMEEYQQAQRELTECREKAKVIGRDLVELGQRLIGQPETVLGPQTSGSFVMTEARFRWSHPSLQSLKSPL